MHILKIIHGYPLKYNAGSEVYSQSICNELSKSHRVSIFTREESAFEPDFQICKSELNTNLEIYHLNVPRGKDGYRHHPIDEKFYELINVLKPDIAHIGHLNHLSTGMVDVLSDLNIPIVFTLHDFWLMCPRGQFLQTNFGNEKFHQLCNSQEHEKCALNCYRSYFSGQKNDWNRDLEYWTNWVQTRILEARSLSNKIDFWIAPSKYIMNRFVNEFDLDAQKMIYLDYGFPMHYLKPVKKNTKREFTFGYIGTHIPAKGVNLLLEAFLNMSKSANLKIWGRENGQNTNSLKEIAKNSNKADKIFWMGEYKNSNIVKDVFEQVDAIVVPSIWGENSPLVIHEAQACHIPVITADFGGMKEYVEHKVNGLLFEHRNPKDLSIKMDYAVDNLEKMKIFGSRGYLYSEDGKVPDIEYHCTKLLEIYKQVIDAKQH